MLVLLGKLIRALEFRRVLFCVLSEVWKFADGAHSGWVNSEMSEEILSGIGLLPLAFADSRAEADAGVTCSGASEEGGGSRTSSGSVLRRRRGSGQQLPRARMAVSARWRVGR